MLQTQMLPEAKVYLLRKGLLDLRNGEGMLLGSFLLLVAMPLLLVASC